jgi:hypothetical protein
MMTGADGVLTFIGRLVFEMKVTARETSFSSSRRQFRLVRRHFHLRDVSFVS